MDFRQELIVRGFSYDADAQVWHRGVCTLSDSAVHDINKVYGTFVMGRILKLLDRGASGFSVTVHELSHYKWELRIEATGLLEMMAQVGDSAHP